MEKTSYWYNFYSPVGSFENILLLPIIYIILLTGTLNFISAEGSEQVYGIIFSVLPLYLIGYDLYHKIKRNNSDVKNKKDE